MYLFLALVFTTLTLIGNIVSLKMVPIGLTSFTAGLFFYPFIFFINDLVTELYGLANARRMILLSFLMGLFGFILIKICLWLPAKDPEIQAILEKTFSLNGLSIFASLGAFGVSQLLDSYIYSSLKKANQPLWIRNQGSLLVSQLVDSMVVHSLFFYWGQGWGFNATAEIIFYSFLYKSLIGIALLPLFIGLVKSRLALES